MTLREVELEAALRAEKKVSATLRVELDDMQDDLRDAMENVRDAQDEMDDLRDEIGALTRTIDVLEAALGDAVEGSVYWATAYKAQKWGD